MKISKKLTIGFSIVICFALITGIIGITGIINLREASFVTYEKRVLGLEYIGKASSAFKQMRIDCRQVVISGLYDDLKGAVDAGENFNIHAEEFKYWLEESKKIGENEELFKFYERIEDLFFNNYMPGAKNLISKSIEDIPDHLNSLYISVYLASLTEAGEIMENLFIGSMDLNTALTEQENINSNKFTQLLINLQALFLIAALIAAALISFFITRSISLPIVESADVLSKIANGDFSIKVKGNYKGELAVIKNSVNETAEKLAIYLKEKLREDKIRELAAIVAVADAGIVIKDKHGIIREWNIGAESILGYKANEAVGCSPEFYISEESYSLFEEFTNRLQNGGHITHAEVVKKHKNGNLVYCSASYTPIFDEQKNYAGSVNVFQDITGQKQTEHKLHEALKAAEEASKAKSSFLARVSHEIRTPMNGIIGITEIACTDREIPAKTKDYLKKIKISADGLLEIINDILDISKIESGRMTLEETPFKLTQVLDNCESICNQKAIKKGISLIFQAGEIVSKLILGDPVKLRQIFLNLLSNAIKFTEKGFVMLVISVTEENEEEILLHFKVKDSGIGMTEEQINKVFEPFVQADDSTTRKYGGTGIGLSITKSMIELMGGKLKAKSTTKKGSEFSFDVRFKICKENEECLKDEEAGKLNLKKPVFKGTVLVCEDNQTNQFVMKEHLAQIGLETVIAENGKTGLEKAKERMAEGKPFDVIFMDVNMPVMDGLEASAKLHECGSKTPIIALTANIMQSDIETYKKHGMQVYLGKPFRARELWGCLLLYLNPSDVVTVKEDEVKSDWESTDEVINKSLGLRHCSNNENLYQRLLINFADDNKTTFNDLINSIETGDIKSAHRIAHTLKGIAGLIGAEDLQKASANAEEALSTGAFTLPNSLTDILGIALKAVMSELKPLMKKEKPEIKSTGILNKEAAVELLEKIKASLELGSSGSLAMLTEIAEVLSPVGELSSTLATRIENYDFDMALETIEEIRKSIESL